MTPHELRASLSGLLRHQLRHSVMIWGPPGIGKSRVVADLAAARNLALVDVRLSQLAPSDLRGLPVPDGDRARWLPPEFLPRDGAGILFLDEINLAPPAIQGIAQQLVLDRQVGSYRVPDAWFVWAAGNRKEDRGAVFDMPAPLANRFIHFAVEPDFDSFRHWATTHGLPEQVLAFLAFRPELLHKLDPQQPAWPSPRTWEIAGALHACGLPIEGAVGAGAAAEFAAFLAVYARMPDLAEILAGRGAAIEFPGEASVRYALTLGLGMRAASADAVGHALEWLGSRATMEWVRLFLQTAWDRAQATRQTGRIAHLVARDARVRRFLKDYEEFLARA